MNLTVHDLTDTASDLGQLAQFYDELYVAGFPDPDERESLANMTRYLQLKASGWYGPNHYHIMLVRDGDRVVAASVSDYLATPNCGVVEFILVADAWRGRGIGRMLHDATVEALHADARRLGLTGVDAIVAELNDPFRVAAQDDNFDPFERALIWDRWGYGRLCFPYVQPALSDEQQPVTYLLLAMKPLVSRFQHAVPPAFALAVLEGYLRWAMRIEEPERDPIFQAMKRFVSALPAVLIEPLSVYIGRDPGTPLTVRPITRATDPAFRAAMEVYARAFPSGPTVVDVRTFEHTLRWTEGRRDLHYHLWALAGDAAAPVAGMVSFFVMPRFAFGGYLALTPPLQGSGRAGIVLKRTEEQIIRDEPGAQAYYVECLPDSREEGIFRRLGFRPLPLRYCQPPLGGGAEFGTGPGPELTLLRKQLGCDYGQAPFAPAEALEHLEGWLRNVYRLADPTASYTYRTARATMG